MGQVIEIICHVAQEGGGNIFKPDWHNPICKCTPWGFQIHFVPVLGAYADLIITKESIHKGEDFMEGT